jgi:hypothetical protein
MIRLLSFTPDFSRVTERQRVMEPFLTVLLAGLKPGVNKR